MTNPYRYSFAASVPTLPTTGTTIDLAVGQIGIFDAKTYQAKANGQAKSIVIAQGTPGVKFPSGVAQGNFTKKSDAIVGRNLRSFKKFKARKGQKEIVTMGFDGVDITKNLTVPVGKSFTYWVTMSGQPAANLLGDTPETHYATITEQFTVTLPCTDDCVSTCGTKYDPNVVADAVLKEHAKRKIIGGQFLSDYIKASKIVSCETPSGATTVTEVKWTLTVCDTGNQTALAVVQAQYPGVVVKRIGRVNSVSTYELTLPMGEVPSPFDNSVLVTIPECEVCPSGYTFVPASDVWVVQRPISETTDLSSPSAQVAFAATVNGSYTTVADATFLSFNGSVATVQIYTAVGSDVVAVLADSVIKTGSNISLCTLDSPTTINWTIGSSCIKGLKEFTLTIKNTDCGANYLDELVALYENIGDVVIKEQNTDTCTTQYSITVKSDNMDCDNCDDILFSFTTPQSFNGLSWEAVETEVYGEDCNVGIKFESIYEQRELKECFLTQVSYEYEPLFITVSTRNPDPNDYSILCEADVPVTKVQGVVYPQGLGAKFFQDVLRSNYNFNHFWRKNPAERDAFSYEIGINLYEYYDEYILDYVTLPVEPEAISGLGNSRVQAFEYHYFFPQGEGTEFENAISAFATQNSDIVLEVIE